MSIRSDDDEALKLFIPVARLLASYTGSPVPSKVTQGYASDPILSVDLDADVILQTAFVRRSNDDESDFLPDFIVETENPDIWTASDIQTYFHDVVSPLPTILPTRYLGEEFGLPRSGHPIAASDHDTTSQQYRKLLLSFDQSPNPATATAILCSFCSNLHAILAHTNSVSVSMAPPAPQLDVINEDPVWNIPNRIPAPFSSISSDIPNFVPKPLLKYLEALISASQVQLVPFTTYLGLVSQWIPESWSHDSIPHTWLGELRDYFIQFYHQRRLSTPSLTTSMVIDA